MARALEPVERLLRGPRVFHRERRLEQDARVARLALQLPILLCQREGLLLVAEKIEVEARFLLLMQFVATQGRRVESGPERLDVFARLRRLERLFCESEAKEQDVRLHPIDEQGDDFVGAPLIEQKIRVRREQKLVVDRFEVRCAEMLLCLLQVALSQRQLGKARQYPDLDFGRGVRILGKGCGKGAICCGGLARSAVEV